MLISFIRTAILLLVVILVLRLMGKRQIGQLQPSELVITILLSQVAAAPMEDNDIPFINTVVVIMVLAGTEVLFSALEIKSVKFRKLIDGSPVILVRDGVPDQRQMKRLRYTINDLTEALRAKDVFDMSVVKYAIAETDGSISVLLNAEKQPVTLGYYEKQPKDPGMPFLLVSDGDVDDEGLRGAGLDRAGLDRILDKERVSLCDVFLLTCDDAGHTNLIRKDADKV